MKTIRQKIKFIITHPSRLSFILRKVYCNVILKRFFKAWGVNSLIQKPLFCSYAFINIGQNVSIGKHARIEAIEEWNGISYKPEIIIGDGVSIEQRLHLVAGERVKIGSNCTISYDVMITDVDHQYEQINTNASHQPLNISETIIGDYCFIGA
ncbi:acyltransferase, partial [Buttiauxella noackiae]|uniref:acyltransferase n=1 Tax=Buttiauxella noackiae TaxID=82992 RepID=UPI0007E451D1